MKRFYFLIVLGLLCSNAFAYEIPTYNFYSYRQCEFYNANIAAERIQQKDYASAKKQLSYCDTYGKNSLEYNLIKGEINLNEGNLDAAEVSLCKAIDRIIPGHYNAYLLYNELAKLYFEKNNLPKALEYSDKAMASYLLEKEFIETRIKILEKYNNSNPKSIIVYTFFKSDLELPDLKDTAQDWKYVLDNLKDADEIQRKNKELTWGEVFEITKRQRESYANKKKNVAIVYLYRAELGFTLGYKKYARDYATYLRNPKENSLDISEIKENVYWASGIIEGRGYDDYKKGIEYLTNALEVNPSEPLYYLQRGWFYFKDKKFDCAFRDIDKSIELCPDSDRAYSLKANFLEYCGDRKKALENYRKALQLNPNNEVAKSNIKRITGKIENTQQESCSDRYTNSRLSVTSTLINIMKDNGFIKRVSQNSGIMTFYVDEDEWFNSSASGIVNTIKIVEEYSLLRGCKISDFKSSKSGKLLLRHRARVLELPKKSLVSGP